MTEDRLFYERHEYEAGRSPGAINRPQADLAMRLDELPRDRRLLVVCQAGSRPLRAAQFLAQAGFTGVASVAGGTAAWIEAGYPVAAGLASGTGRHQPETDPAPAAAFQAS